MAKKLFSINFTSYVFQQTDNPALHVCNNFESDQMTKNINSILNPQGLKYNDGSLLSYHFNGDGLIVTGLADSYNPDAPAFL